MKAWLLTNTFLTTDKFNTLYKTILNAAASRNLQMDIAVWEDIAKSGVLPDFALLWDKDFYAASILENRGVRIFNSVKASEICDDKAKTAICLNQAGIAAPPTVISPKTYDGTGYAEMTFLDTAASVTGYPMIIKEVFGSFGKQVYLARSRQEAENIILNLGSKSFIMQKFISECSGTDIRINIIGGKFVSAIRRTNRNDFRSNITGGGTASDYRPTEREIETAVNAAKAAGCDFAGVDILQADIPLVCEINSSPHFKSSTDTNGIDIAGAIIDYAMGVL